MAAFNHRFSAAYVTDGVGETYVEQSDDYPVSRDSLTFGWVAAAAPTMQYRDRNSGIDPRLAGANLLGNSNGRKLFATDSGAGTFDVTLAIGQATFSTTANYLEIVEHNSSQVVQSILATVLTGESIAGTNFYDANSALHTSDTDWVSNNTPLQVTVSAGNHVGIRIGDPAASASGDSVIAHFAYEAVASGPVITDVNTTDIVQVGDTPTVTGTAFGAVEGSQTFDGETVGVDTWADTSIVCDAIVRNDKSYGAHDWVVTHDDTTASSPLSVILSIDTGFQFVNLVDPINILVGGEITSLCYNTSPACVTGDQLKVPTLTDQGKAIDISAADGTFVITDAGNTEQTFEFEIWDATGPTNEKWSLSTAAVINGVIVSGSGIVSQLVSNIVSNIVSNT